MQAPRVLELLAAKDQVIHELREKQEELHADIDDLAGGLERWELWYFGELPAQPNPDNIPRSDSIGRQH